MARAAPVASPVCSTPRCWSDSNVADPTGTLPADPLPMPVEEAVRSDDDTWMGTPRAHCLVCVSSVHHGAVHWMASYGAPAWSGPDGESRYARFRFCRGAAAVNAVDVTCCDVGRRPGHLTEDVSREHCEVFVVWRWSSQHQSWYRTQCVVTDLDSLHGTWCNSVRLVPQHPYVLREPVASSGADVFLCLADSVLVVVPWSSLQRRTHHAVREHASVQTEDLHESDDGRVEARVLLKRSRRKQTASITAASRRQPNKPPIDSSLCSAVGSATGPRRVVVMVDDCESGSPDAAPGPPHSSVHNVSALPTIPILSYPIASEPLVIITTGTRLTADERRKCDSLRIIVNPPIGDFRLASLLVIEPPLARSVKLLTAVPYVHQFVHRSWLDAVLACGRLSVPVTRYVYAETYTRRSIEGVNEFRIEELMGKTTPASRQLLLAPHAVFVHPDAEPQDQPHNDLKSVVTASGGLLCDDPSVATLVVLPNAASLNSKQLQQWQQTQQQSESAIRITVDDLFRAVLQQRRPCTSTVPCLQSAADKSSDADRSTSRKRVPSGIQIPKDVVPQQRRAPKKTARATPSQEQRSDSAQKSSKRRR